MTNPPNSPPDNQTQSGQDRQRTQKLRYELEKGMNSGISPLTIPEIIARAKARLKGGSDNPPGMGDSMPGGFPPTNVLRH
ncbi:MAG: hypothetical protein QM537_09045 [Candidatus Symbiobacter sp.]|nr:hypothetical protein [Candidatus Symbiobacter sp.]